MVAPTRACETCGIVATIEAIEPGRDRVSWADGNVEVLRGLPPDGSIRCRAHRAGSRWSHRCAEGFVHATVDQARACEGHDEERGGVPAFGLHVRGE
jgi:hypothetical protein